MTRRKHVLIAFFCILVGLIIITYFARISILRPMEDQRYRTPIPESTIRAYSFGAPISDRLQAVIAARAFLNGTRLESLQPPEVILAERMALAEAKKKTTKPGDQSYEGLPLDTSVWFVIFKGVWRVHPPDPEHTITPLPPMRGCQYVWMPENEGGYGATSGIDCVDTK
jgi:hypothetical protein